MRNGRRPWRPILIALLAVSAAGCGPLKPRAAEAPELRVSSVDSHLAPHTFLLLRDLWRNCRGLRGRIYATIDSDDVLERQHVSRESRIESYQRGEGRATLAAIDVLRSETERRIVALESARETRAGELREGFDEVHSYCSDLTRPGSTASFSPRGEMDEGANDAREGRIEARLASIFDAPPILTQPDPTGVRRTRAMAEAAARKAQLDWNRESTAAALLLQQATSELDRDAKEPRWRDPATAPSSGSETKRGTAVLSSGVRRIFFNWRWYVRQGRTRVEARIENVGTLPIAGGMAKVVLYSSSDHVLAKRNAYFESRLLAPGSETFLSLVLPPIHWIDHSEFTLVDGEGNPIETSRPIETHKSAQPPETP